jgi:hypothetical protein
MRVGIHESRQDDAVRGIELMQVVGDPRREIAGRANPSDDTIPDDDAGIVKSTQLAHPVADETGSSVRPDRYEFLDMVHQEVHVRALLWKNEK